MFLLNLFSPKSFRYVARQQQLYNDSCPIRHLVNVVKDGMCLRLLTTILLSSKEDVCNFPVPSGVPISPSQLLFCFGVHSFFVCYGRIY